MNQTTVAEYSAGSVAVDMLCGCVQTGQMCKLLLHSRVLGVYSQLKLTTIAVTEALHGFVLAAESGTDCRTLDCTHRNAGLDF